jgi:glycosyltransferase involved in cell wall biosynthesis
MPRPLVSVIVPNYNHEQFLGLRIQSILDQDFSDFELILLDDASTDNSSAIINHYSVHPKTAFFETNSINSASPFSQWKKGLSVAQGEFIWIAESDDLADKSFLSSMSSLLLSNPNASLAYCRSPAIDSRNHLSPEQGYWPDNFHPTRWHTDFVSQGSEERSLFLKYANTIPNASSVLFRKSIADNCVIPSGMRYVGDWFFWLQMSEKGQISYTSKEISFFRFHEQTTRTTGSRHTIRARFQESLLLLDTFGISPKFTRDNRLTGTHNWITRQWQSHDRNIPLWVLKLKNIRLSTRLKTFLFLSHHLI